MHFTTKAAAALAIANAVPQAFGHYIFDKLILNGQATGQWEYVRKLADSQSNSPIFDVTSNDIRCMPGGLTSGPTTGVAAVKAGDTVGFTVNSNMGHPGPATAYMSKATGNVTAYQGDGDWFKIWDAGVKTFATDGQQLTWVTDGVTQVSFKIPTAIEDGEYLLRMEHIATHEAGRVGGAQFYISCAQISVTGGAGGSPSPVGKFPGIYTATDPGINFEPYYPPVVSYEMPGLAVYGGAAGGNAAPGAGSGSGSTTTAAPASVSRAAATTLATSARSSFSVVNRAQSSTVSAPIASNVPGKGKNCRLRRRGLKNGPLA